jgi:HNH endonuclease
MSRPIPFCYPATQHVRKHGPRGHKKPQDYRQWLRDEFDFICVYCLRREIWDERSANFECDHLLPRKHAPHLILEYTNLVYACSSCNRHKATNPAPDPCFHAYGRLVEVHTDGTIRALNPEGKMLIRAARLDDAKTTAWRRLLIGTLRSHTKHAPDLYRAMLGFPSDLPDLTKITPPGGNTQTGSEHACRYQQRLKGQLPPIIEIS